MEDKPLYILAVLILFGLLSIFFVAFVFYSAPAIKIDPSIYQTREQ